MATASPQDITDLLQAWSAGQHDALQRLTPLVYGELHRLENIVRHFLSLAGPSSLDLRPVEVGKLISYVCELLRPEARYECPGLPNVPSAAGEIEGPAQQPWSSAMAATSGRSCPRSSASGPPSAGASRLRTTAA